MANNCFRRGGRDENGKKDVCIAFSFSCRYRYHYVD